MSSFLSAAAGLVVPELATAHGAVAVLAAGLVSRMAVVVRLGESGVAVAAHVSVLTVVGWCRHSSPAMKRLIIDRLPGVSCCVWFTFFSPNKKMCDVMCEIREGSY